MKVMNSRRLLGLRVFYVVGNFISYEIKEVSVVTDSQSQNRNQKSKIYTKETGKQTVLQDTCHRKKTDFLKAEGIGL